MTAAIQAHARRTRRQVPSLLDPLVVRPEIGALLGAVLVFVFFSVVTGQFLSPLGVATWLDDSSTLGIMAVVVALLMVGGEFDLSAGVMTASTSLVTAILATQAGWNVWLALLVSLVFALGVGAFNGWLVMKTGLPSFIVTLGYLPRAAGPQPRRDAAGHRHRPGVGHALDQRLRVGGRPVRVHLRHRRHASSSRRSSGGSSSRRIAAWLLVRTRFGNWIFAVGGSQVSARSVGVPVVRTKILLFMGTALGAWLVGSINILRFASVQANQGIGLEFQYIIAAVIGGCLLTGGFGSAVGAAIGALIFGMARQGIVFAQWNSDWFMLFLGIMLLAAVLVNNAFRRRAERVRR